MSLSLDLNSMMKTAEPYSATMGFDENGYYTTKLTGDRTSGLFTPKEGLGKMDFLKLLTTQLQYQDPLEPMENTEFVAQLAQFTQLESTTSMQQSMESMVKTFNDSMDLQTFNSQSTTNAASVSLVGKEVRLRQNTFEHSRTNPENTFKVHFGEKAEVIVDIVDGDGNVVKSITVKDKDETNAAEFTWDGTNDRGELMASDTYNLVVRGSENNESLYCFVEDFVTGIRYTAQGTMLRVSGVEIPVGNILEVRTPSGNTAASADLSMGQALSLVNFNARVSMPDNQIKYEAEPNGNVVFNLDASGDSSVTIAIRDENGRVMETITYTRAELDNLRNEIVLQANNFGTNGKVFSIEIVGENANAYFYREGTIAGVQNRNGIPMFNVNGEYYGADRIIELTPPTAAAA